MEQMIDMVTSRPLLWDCPFHVSRKKAV